MIFEETRYYTNRTEKERGKPEVFPGFVEYACRRRSEAGGWSSQRSFNRAMKKSKALIEQLSRGVFKLRMIEPDENGTEVFIVIRLVDSEKSLFCYKCNQDFFDSNAEGGMIYAGKPICPDCSGKVVSEIAKDGTAELIQATCPEGQTFKEFALSHR